jgi:PAS domain S-box-containing protein
MSELAAIRVLVVDDNPLDAELAEREVRRALSQCVFRRVDTREAFLQSLATFAPDVILSDYSMPRFDGLTALTLAISHAPLVPVIIVTAAINEDTAVECMKAGAVDYVIKEHIKRLGQAVVQALEQKKVQEARRQAEDDLRIKSFALESSGVPVCLCDLSGLIFYVNNAFHQLSGCATKDELLGKPITCFSSPKQAGGETDDLGRVGLYTGAGTFTRADGSRIDVEASASVAAGTEGRPLCLMGTFVDLSERLALERQLEQARKMESIGQLAGGIAHDFNNMLTVVLGHVELLKQDLAPGAPAADDLLAVERAAWQSREMARQLLSFARQQIITPSIRDLNEHVLGTRGLLSRLIGEQVTLNFEPGPDLWPVKFDPGQLDQVLLNLVVNARDAMPRGGTIRIETTNVTLDDSACRDIPQAQPGAYVCLSIRDEGIGIDADTLPRIFEPFFTTKGTDLGTGLGLATVYGIVKQNDWLIRVQSASGRGATFDILVPKAEPDAPVSTVNAVASHDAAPNDADSRAVTVLLVEDNDMVRRLTTKLLRALRYDVVVADSPSAALSRVDAGLRPHLLLTDVVMPEMSGVELHRLMVRRIPGVKTVFVSGHTGYHAVGEVLAEQDVVFVQKPFTKQDLDVAIQQLLR